MKLPEIGKTYYYFDDGKIKLTRREEVIITEIIPFNEIDSETLRDWKEEVIECHWLYAKHTDYFIKAELKIDEDLYYLVFVRTLDNRWFSLGWWAGVLDVDGTLNNKLNEHTV